MAGKLYIAGTAFDPLDPQAPVVRGSPWYQPDGKHDAQGDGDGKRVPLHLPEPAERREGQLQPPDDEGEDKDGNAVQAIPGRSSSPAVRVAVDMACGEDNVQDQQDREDGYRREEGGDCLPGIGVGH